MTTPKPGTRCACYVGREPFHACGLALGQGDKQCRRDATRMVTVHRNTYPAGLVDLYLCDACAKYHESKAGAQ